MTCRQALTLLRNRRSRSKTTRRRTRPPGTRPAGTRPSGTCPARTPDRLAEIRNANATDPLRRRINRTQRQSVEDQSRVQTIRRQRRDLLFKRSQLGGDEDRFREDIGGSGDENGVVSDRDG